MSIAAGTTAPRPTPAFLSLSFRPFFLAAGLWSVVALALWIVVFVTGAALPPATIYPLANMRIGWSGESPYPTIGIRCAETARIE